MTLKKNISSPICKSPSDPEAYSALLTSKRYVERLKRALLQSVDLSHRKDFDKDLLNTPSETNSAKLSPDFALVKALNALKDAKIDNDKNVDIEGKVTILKYLVKQLHIQRIDGNTWYQQVNEVLKKLSEQVDEVGNSGAGTIKITNCAIKNLSEQFKSLEIPIELWSSRVTDLIENLSGPHGQKKVRFNIESNDPTESIVNHPPTDQKGLLDEVDALTSEKIEGVGDNAFDEKIKKLDNLCDKLITQNIQPKSWKKEIDSFISVLRHRIELATYDSPSDKLIDLTKLDDIGKKITKHLNDTNGSLEDGCLAIVNQPLTDPDQLLKELQALKDAKNDNGASDHVKQNIKILGDLCSKFITQNIQTHLWQSKVSQVITALESQIKSATYGSETGRTSDLGDLDRVDKKIKEHLISILDSTIDHLEGIFKRLQKDSESVSKVFEKQQINLVQTNQYIHDVMVASKEISDRWEIAQEENKTRYSPRNILPNNISEALGERQKKLSELLGERAHYLGEDLLLAHFRLVAALNQY